MDNFYEILGLDDALDSDALKKEMNKVQKKWIGRQNAPDLKRRQEAERILNLIQQAEQVLLDDHKRQEYNEQILHREVKETEVATSVGEDVSDLIAQAWELMQENRYADAIMVAKQATAEDGGSANAWGTMGYAHYMWNDFDLAIEAYKQAISLAPNNSESYYDLANVYLDHPEMHQQDKLVQAKQLNMKALHIKPHEVSYQLQSAIIERGMENFDGSIAILENLLAKDPDNPSYRNELSTAYYIKALSLLFHQEDESLYYVIKHEDGEKALNNFRNALSYTNNENDVAEINYWVDICHKSLQKQFDFPGYKAFVIPVLTMIIGFASATVWLILVAITVIGWISYANYVPEWKINKRLLRQHGYLS